MATRLMMMALSGWLSACYSLPSDGCVPGSCAEGLACIQQNCVVPAEPAFDAGGVTADAAAEAGAPGADAGAAEAGVGDAASPQLDAAAGPDAGLPDAGAEDAGVVPMPNCGDGVLQEDEDEECDDGPLIHRGCVGCMIQPAGTGMFLGEGYGCALVLDQNDRRQINCWGSNDFQRLGADPAIKQRLIPTPHSDNASLSSVVQIAGGASAVCAVVRGFQDQILCWGDREYANSGGTEPSYAPERVTLPEGFDQPVHQIAVSSNRPGEDAGDTICAIVGDQRHVVCWGYDHAGQTGRGSIGERVRRYRVEPAVVMERGDRENVAIADIDSLAMGSDYVVALRTDPGDRKELIGWGRIPGLEGDGRVYAVELPSLWVGQRPNESPMFQGSATSLTAGRGHFCVLTDADLLRHSRIWCFGDNTQYQLGSITVANTRASVGLGVNDLPTSVHAFASGTCAVGGPGGASNKLWCWGDHSHGQLGSQDGRQTTHTPQQIAVYEQNIDLMVAGTQAKFRCVDSAGAIDCWGRNDKDQTGNRYAGENTGEMQRLTLRQAEQPTGTEDSPITHCLASRDLGQPSGLKWLGWGDGNRYTVYCDNDVAHDGGGWALAMELNTSSWDDEAPPLRYDDLFWEDPSRVHQGDPAPQDPIASTRKYAAALEQRFKDLRFELAPVHVAWGTSAGNEQDLTAEVEGDRPSWLRPRARSFSALLSGPQGAVTLHNLFTGGQRALTMATGGRARWLPGRSHLPPTQETDDGLVPLTRGTVGGRTLSPIMDINQDNDFSVDDTTCYWAGFNLSHSVNGTPNVAQLRFGVLTSKRVGGGCGTSHYNYIGVGMDHHMGFTYYPPVGAFGSTPDSGANRTALWSDARIWVR